MQLFELVIGMMLAIIALHYVARRLRLPPSIALLAGGAALAFLPGLPEVELDPALVLVIFLPPLLMDGAWFIALGHLKRQMIGIASLAVGAVLFTTLVVAATAHLLMPSLPWAACAALGAIVSPPDAISLRAILANVRLPRRLSILLEGESLLNDASGLVLFRFAVVAVATGGFSTVDALESFCLLALGGAVVGIVIGAAWVVLVKRLGDEYLMIAASVLSPWAAYMAGEGLAVSGVIATVTTGLICGWYQHVVFPASVRLRGTSFWTVMIFLMEGAVFMLIGSSLRGVLAHAGGLEVVLGEMAVPVLLILLALTAARFVWVFASDAVILGLRAIGFCRDEPLGFGCSVVLGWAGMRGVVTLAVALSVPDDFPGRDFILVTAFAVILIPVLVQGTTLGAVIRWARLVEPEHERVRLGPSEAEAAMARAQLVLVEARAYDADGNVVHPQLLERYRRRATIYSDYVGKEVDYAPRLHAHFDLILEVIAAGRAELLRMHRAGDIDEQTLHTLERALDLEELGAIAAKS